MPNKKLKSAAKTSIRIAALAAFAFVLLTASSLAWMEGNWMFALGLIIGGVFLYWFIDEADADDAAADTADRVAERADGLFGGLIGGSGAFLLSMAAISLTALDQILMTVDILLRMLGAEPILTLALAGIGSVLGLAAMLGLQADTAGLLIVALIVAVVLLRRRFKRAASNRGGL